jgi:hypothetical protein
MALAVLVSAAPAGITKEDEVFRRTVSLALSVAAVAAAQQNPPRNSFTTATPDRAVAPLRRATLTRGCPPSRPLPFLTASPDGGVHDLFVLTA